MNITVTDRNGEKRALEVKPNPASNLMEVLVANAFDVPAICGGMAGCGTCHVGVVKGLDKLFEPEADEEFMLDSLPNLTKQSRLSCQIPLTDQLDGLEVVVLGDGA